MMCRPINCGPFEYAPFSSEISIGRRIVGSFVLAAGVAMAIILALGMSEVLPSVYGEGPLQMLIYGAFFSLGVGMGLVGILPS